MTTASLRLARGSSRGSRWAYARVVRQIRHVALAGRHGAREERRLAGVGCRPAVSHTTCFAGPPMFRRSMMRTTFITRSRYLRIQKLEREQAPEPLAPVRATAEVFLATAHAGRPCARGGATGAARAACPRPTDAGRRGTSRRAARQILASSESGSPAAPDRPRPGAGRFCPRVRGVSCGRAGTRQVLHERPVQQRAPRLQPMRHRHAIHLRQEIIEQVGPDVHTEQVREQRPVIAVSEHRAIATTGSRPD